MTDVVAGYTPWGFDVAEVAYLRVATTIKTPVVDSSSERPFPSADDTVAIMFRGGSMNMYGHSICEERPANFYEPTVGSWIVATGTLYEGDSRLLIQDFVFPIEGNEVLPQPYGRLRKDAQAKTLVDISQEGREGSARRQ